MSSLGLFDCFQHLLVHTGEKGVFDCIRTWNMEKSLLYLQLSFAKHAVEDLESLQISIVTSSDVL